MAAMAALFTMFNGQRFDVNGDPTGEEFLVNETQVSGYQYTPEVVGLANGGFAIRLARR